MAEVGGHQEQKTLASVQNLGLHGRPGSCPEPPRGPPASREYICLGSLVQLRSYGWRLSPKRAAEAGLKWRLPVLEARAMLETEQLSLP